MTKIEPGKYVELGYDLYAVEADGSEKLVHQSDASEHEKIVIGVSRVVINGLVKEVTDTKVKMDFNHPLAGERVRFDGRITEVRDATEAELHPAQGCGCHGHGEGDCGCGDDCGCDHDHEGGCCGGCH